MFFVISIFLFFSQHAFADNLILFDIEKQRADRAIIAFAQKTNKTIVFSYNLTKKYQANALKGRYSADEGLKKLLDNIGLIAVIDNNQLRIQQVEQPKTITKNQKPEITNNKNSYRQDIEKISVIGSRVSGRLSNDLPVPVDILTSEVLINTGQTEVGRMLQTIAPSFNFPSSAISDGTDAIRPATLRGLGPDQTLVLVNGKRRHQASLLHINSSVGRGTTGTDMNAIPATAIKRIEVLRDGAAAQYGSDAIAGVINIVLKDDDSQGSAAVSYGKHKKGDGATTNIALNKGFSLADKGFINTSLTLRKRELTDRSGLHGTCLYPNCLETSSNTFLATDPRELSASRNTFIVGDADTEQLAFILNAAYEVFSGQTYGFITFSERKNISDTFFRHNNDTNNPYLQDGEATIEQGFLPKINSDIRDISYNIGYQQDFNDNASLDFSYTFGKNNIDYTTTDTINASYANALSNNTSGITADDIRKIIPRTASAYGLVLTQQSINLDFTRDFDLFSLALGGELRADRYQVTPGDEYSYQDYDTLNCTSLFPIDLSAGTQGFRGIGPQSSVDETSQVISFYVDTEVQVTENVLISTALRYDNYKDFSDSANAKLAGHWVLDQNLAIRGSISSGFRAPSMQQLYFNNISTQFVNDPDNPLGDQIPLQVGTFRNDSLLALAIGIPKLKEENSMNYSLGAVIKLSDSANLTIDYYAINIKDRIVISDKLRQGLSPLFDTALELSGANAGQFFLNGADTKTSGLDIIATWHTPFFTGDLNLTFAANFTDTEVVDLYTPIGGGLGNIPAEEIFSEQDISIIEEWQPQDRLSLTSLYKINDFTINLAFNRYGKYTISDGGRQTFNAEILTDLRINYQINNNLSINIGSNNLFNVYPDKNQISNSRAGTIVDSQGNTIVNSQGIFTYSRRSAPFGFNGAYYYLGLEYSFN
jgi:iron complex outermembrane receptor protein